MDIFEPGELFLIVLIVFGVAVLSHQVGVLNPVKSPALQVLLLLCYSLPLFYLRFWALLGTYYVI